MERIATAIALLMTCWPLATARTAEPAATTDLVRIGLVDCSGSMTGERLDAAKAELLEQGRQLPPSARHPFTLVPFDIEVKEVKTFTDLPAFEKYIGSLTAGGGTRIAAGLKQAIGELRRQGDPGHVCLYLITDGEDGDESGIRAAEAELSKLFAVRSQRGLSQSVVFLKRWENANAKLLEALRQGKLATVVDAGQLKFQTVLLTPQFRVAAVRWVKDQPGVADIELSARIDATGAVAGTAFPAVHATWRAAATARPEPFEVTPAAPAKTLTCRVPVAPEQAAAGKLTLEVQFTAPSALTSRGAAILPALAAPRLTLPVALPARAVTVRLKASLTFHQPPQWADPRQRRARCDLTLQLEADSMGGLPWPGPVTVALAPAAGLSVVSGQSTLTLPAAGRHAFPLTVELAAPAAAGGPNPAMLVIGLELNASTPATGLMIEPPKQTVRAESAAPPDELVTLAARPLRVHPGRWIDLAAGVAAYEIDVELTATGPVVPNAVFTVTVPAAVRSLAMTPRTFRTGTQTIRVAIEVAVAPAPATQALAFPIQPPPDQGAVRHARPDPLRLTVPGPPAARLVLRHAGTGATTFAGELPDPDGAAEWPVTAEVVGAVDPRAAQAVRANLQPSTGLTLDHFAALPAGTASTVTVRRSSGPPPDFFFDTQIEGQLTITPAQTSRALVGSTQMVMLRSEAPFKRWLLRGVGALAALVVLICLARLYLRLARGEPDRRGPSPGGPRR